MALPMRKFLFLKCQRHLIIFSRKYSSQGVDNVRVRFAPSPTGSMHLGGLRTALYNYLFAKSKEGSFILRIEDTDKTRVVPGATEELISVLKWAGLHPDEGPDIGGDYGPYVQSERKNLYQEYVKHLLQSGHAYRCFCTQKRLDLLRKEQLRQGETAGYDNKCRHLTQEEVQEKLSQNIPHVIRFKYEPVQEPCTDLIHGLTNTKLVGERVEGDFVIIKSDSYPTYHFANVVDDHLMKISHVLRGEEWSISTPKHIQMYEAFGWQPPKYAHLPLILNSDGTKLSKRQNDIQVDVFRKKHTDPNALLNYLTTSNGGFTESTEGKTLTEMVKMFSLDLVTRHSTRLQPERLRQISKLHLVRQLEDNRQQAIEAARQTVLTHYGDRISKCESWVLEDSYIGRTLDWGLQERIYELGDLVSGSMEFVWRPPSEDALRDHLTAVSSGQSVLTDCVRIVQQMDSFEEEKIKQAFVKCCKDRQMTSKTFFGLLRKSLSGVQEGAPVAEMIVMLGKDETLKRLRRAADLALQHRKHDVAKQ